MNKSLPVSPKVKSRQPAGKGGDLLEVSPSFVHSFIQQGFPELSPAGPWGTGAADPAEWTRQVWVWMGLIDAGRSGLRWGCPWWEGSAPPAPSYSLVSSTVPAPQPTPCVTQASKHPACKEGSRQTVAEPGVVGAGALPRGRSSGPEPCPRPAWWWWRLYRKCEHVGRRMAVCRACRWVGVGAHTCLCGSPRVCSCVSLPICLSLPLPPLCLSSLLLWVSSFVCTPMPYPGPSLGPRLCEPGRGRGGGCGLDPTSQEPGLPSGGASFGGLGRPAWRQGWGAGRGREPGPPVWGLARSLQC